MKNIIACISACLCLFSHTAHAQPHRFYDLLAARQYDQLEQETQAVQKQFEAGAISEFDLRSAFEDFSHLNDNGFTLVVEWERQFNKSYGAHLAKGIHYRKESMQPSQQAGQQPPDVIRTIAIDELNESMLLTIKPYLSIFYLIDIVKPENQSAADILLKKATDILPKSVLVRNQYMQYLSPRFGGSLEMMHAFIGQSQQDGSVGSGIQQLEAIYEDELGSIDQEEKHRMMSINHYGVALAISQDWGVEFRREFIPNADKAACREPELKKFCQR